jgi:uncharacterized membrane protein YhaH (DUF805 family)
MSGYVNAMRRYVEFGGRSSRSEFWFFVLFYIIIAVVASILDAVVFNSQGGIGILYGIVLLVHLIPSISVSVRRLHDIDRTGWWVLVFFLAPIVVLIVSMIAMGGSIIAMMSGGEEAAAAGIASMGVAFLIMALVNLVILIVAIVFYVTPGPPGPNRFGPAPT